MPGTQLLDSLQVVSNGDPNPFQWPPFGMLLQVRTNGGDEARWRLRTRPTGATPQRKLIKRREVEELTGLGRSMIYKLKAKGLFPQPVEVSPHAVGWFLDEVLDYINTRPRRG